VSIREKEWMLKTSVGGLYLNGQLQTVEIGIKDVRDDWAQWLCTVPRQQRWPAKIMTLRE
jgi:hypothetical protein